MAQRRSTRGAVDEEPATRRRPARRRDRQPADRDEPEAVDTEDIADDYDLEPADSDEAEPADSEEPEEPEAVEDLEPDEAADEPADDDGRERPSRRAERRVNGSGLTARKAARAALSQIMELTDKSAEGITEVRRTDDGWVVGIEIVEDRRIPSAADILATYEVTLDAEGELMSYRRARRYMRGRGDSGDGS